MRKLTSIILFIFIVNISYTQSTNTIEINKACFDYLEGFYEGDTVKIMNSLKPSL